MNNVIPFQLICDIHEIYGNGNCHIWMHDFYTKKILLKMDQNTNINNLYDKLSKKILEDIARAGNIKKINDISFQWVSNLLKKHTFNYLSQGKNAVCFRGVVDKSHINISEQMTVNNTRDNQINDNVKVLHTGKNKQMCNFYARKYESLDGWIYTLNSFKLCEYMIPLADGVDTSTEYAKTILKEKLQSKLIEDKEYRFHIACIETYEKNHDRKDGKNFLYLPLEYSDLKEFSVSWLGFNGNCVKDCIIDKTHSMIETYNFFKKKEIPPKKTNVFLKITIILIIVIFFILIGILPILFYKLKFGRSKI